jgi:hypothetical protein
MALGGMGSALSTVAACGGVGAFIDFLMSKSDQKRLRDWLETWWLRFSYVDARSFGREEALYALAVIDRVLGRKFLSYRRLLSTTLIGVAVGIVVVMLALFSDSQSYWSDFGNPFAATVLFRDLVFFFLVFDHHYARNHCTRRQLYGACLKR